MTTLQLIRAASTRLGMVAPSTVPQIVGTATTIEDKDALLLLGALNAAVKNVTFMYSWRELIRQASFQPNIYDDSAVVTPAKPAPPNPLGANIMHGFDINKICVGFDGIISNCLLDPLRHQKIPLLTYEKYLERIYDNNVDPIYENANWNGYIITNNLLNLVIRYGEGAAVDPLNKIYLYYKTKYPVVKAAGNLYVDNDLQQFFVNADDWSPIDDEVLILGTVVNYKNYIGRDFQLEFKQFNDYIEHMKERTGGVTIIEESSYNEMSNIFRRYPPVGQGGQGNKAQGNQPKK
jgi:hypothetical protein